MSVRVRFKKRKHYCPKCKASTSHRVIERDPKDPDRITLRCIKCERVCTIQVSRNTKYPPHIRLYGHRFRMNKAYSRENEVCAVCGRDR